MRFLSYIHSAASGFPVRFSIAKIHFVADTLSGGYMKKTIYSLVILLIIIYPLFSDGNEKPELNICGIYYGMPKGFFDFAWNYSILDDHSARVHSIKNISEEDNYHIDFLNEMIERSVVTVHFDDRNEYILGVSLLSFFAEEDKQEFNKAYLLAYSMISMAYRYPEFCITSDGDKIPYWRYDDSILVLDKIEMEELVNRIEISILPPYIDIEDTVNRSHEYHKQG